MSRPRKDDLMQQIQDLRHAIEAAATRTGTSAMDPATQAPAASSRVTSANPGEPIDLTQEPSGRPHDAVDPLARSSAAGNRPSARGSVGRQPGPSTLTRGGRSQRASPRRRSRSPPVRAIPIPARHRSPQAPEFRVGPTAAPSSSSRPVRLTAPWELLRDRPPRNSPPRFRGRHPSERNEPEPEPDPHQLP